MIFTREWSETNTSGTLRFSDSSGAAVERSFTALPGGAATIFTHEASGGDASIIVCDERAPGAAGLTPCGAAVRL